MNRLKKIFMYLLIVLFISIFFQSVVILFIKHSKDEQKLSLAQKFQNTFLNTDAASSDKHNAKTGANQLLQTLSNVVSTFSSDGVSNEMASEKMVVSVRRSSQIEAYQPVIEKAPLPVQASRPAVSASVSQTPKRVIMGESIDIPYGKKIIFHTLACGEKLSELSKIYGVDLDVIKKINGFGDSYRLYVGQKIMIIQTNATASAVCEKIQTVNPVESKENARISSNEAEPSIDNLLKSSKGAKTYVSKAKNAKIENSSVNNGFGESDDEAKLNAASSKSKDPLADIIKSAKKKRRVFKWPVRGVITSKYGMRMHPVYAKSALHTGIDIGAPKGRQIKPAMGGTVSFAGWMGGYGKMIEVKHPKGYVTRYAHLSKIKIKAGQSVNSSTSIGEVGDTGTSTGYHLHFEIRKYGKPLNPVAFLRN